MMLDAKYQGYICLVVSDMKRFSCFPYIICSVKGILGSKDCSKELKLECAYFLGQTS